MLVRRWQFENASGAKALKLGGPASYGSYAVSKRMGKIDKTLDLRGMRVLDLGCGNGCYTQELARRAESVCGIDLHMPHLQAFREAIPRVQGSGEHLPCAAESFDAVTMIEVLEHTDSDTKVLAECFRVLKPGGLLVFFVPNKFYLFETHPCRLGTFSLGRNVPLVSWLPESLRRHICYARIYTRHRLFAMARKTGFHIQDSGFIFPPLDSFSLPFRDTYRRIAARLEDSPLGNLGVSIYAVLAKPAHSVKTARLEPDNGRFKGATFDVLGVRTHAVEIAQVVEQMKGWIRERNGCHSIALANPSFHLLDDLRDLHGVRSNSQYIERRTFKAPVVRLYPRCFDGLCWLCQNCVNGDPQIAKRRILQTRSDSPVRVPKGQ